MKTWMLFLSILLAPLSLQAQNVTIKATNGSMIASMKNGGQTDTFFNLGGFASWQHEQLSMVMTVADDTQKTESGQLANPANNIFRNGDKIQIAHGQVNNADNCYVTISLPKGYRFTGYIIKFTKPRNAQNSQFNTGNAGTASSTFGETNSSFTYMANTGDNRAQASININGLDSIYRESQTEGDMSNVLYFRLQYPDRTRALIQFESAEFFFTAEENYSPVTPAGTITSPVSAVDISFPTSKVDFGTIESRTYNGVTRISYSSANVHDLAGKLHLYEAESTKAGTGLDGTSGQVVDYKSGTISSQDNYFKLGRDNQEQVYFIETPDNVEVSDGTKVPVGYRIVGAEFEYKLPNAEIKYYITYTSGGTTYYLGTNGQFSTTRTEWNRDNNGRIYSGNTYLGYDVGGNILNRTFTFRTYTSVPDHPLSVNANNHISGSYAFYTLYLKYNNGNATVAQNENGNLASWTGETDSDNDFTLYVYDKTGANKTGYAVNSSNPSGKVSITGLNNDAVKFGVQGIGLVRATLTMQALDPYLDKMTVVCQDEEATEIRLTETFTASDFSVNGGEFYFYLPSGLNGTDVLITFEELKSKYFDETYEGGSASHTSRINFVKSDHYNAFGQTNNNLYSNTAEAASATPLERLVVGTVGTAKFKFNNADQVGTGGGTYKEYPFSLEKYAADPNNGSFTNMEFTVSAEDQHLTRYVFTTDETRYNIAPTTATQHRAYAYYQMIVHVQSSTYDTKFEFEKIYDNTFYDVNSNSIFYNVKVTATDGSGAAGYSSTDVIYDGITKILTETHKDDFNNNIPENTDYKQILNLDFSQLKGIYHVATEHHSSLEDFLNAYAPNCLIFVPEGSSGNSNNVAYKMASGGYRAANNIVLTDKHPFYSPYDIQVDAANYVKYERQISKSGYNPVECASIILPFAINLEQAATGASSFTLHTMQNDNAITTTGDKPWAYFPDLGDGATTSEPNKPYLLQVTSNTSENGSFVIIQNGARIAKTTKGNTVNGMKYIYPGTTSTGTFAEGNEGGNTYQFTSYGTLSGIEIAKENGIFYFAQGRFLNSSTLASSVSTVKILPFRSFYTTSPSNNPAKFSTLDIIFGEGMGDEPDAIRDLKQVADLGVKAGHGTLTIASKIDNNVRVNGVNGVARYNIDMKAGEVKTVNVPAGIYVVNGVKIIVK